MEKESPDSRYAIMPIPGAATHIYKLALVVPLLLVIVGGLLAAR